MTLFFFVDKDGYVKKITSNIRFRTNRKNSYLMNVSFFLGNFFFILLRDQMTQQPFYKIETRKNNISIKIEVYKKKTYLITTLTDQFIPR